MRRRVAVMARISRTTWLKGAALVVAFASLTINFGLIDLVDGFTGYVDQARNQILDVGWGAVFAVILPLGLLTQLRRPERRIAGIQQTVVVAFALALAGVAGQNWWYLALAGGIAVASAVLLALHPARQTFLARRQREPMMLALAAVAAIPTLAYAWRMASAQRRDLPPADAVSNGLHHWTVIRRSHSSFSFSCCLPPLAPRAGESRRSARRSQRARGRSPACSLRLQRRAAKAMPGRGRRSYGPLSPWPRSRGRERVTKLLPERLNSKPRDPRKVGKAALPHPLTQRSGTFANARAGDGSLSNYRVVITPDRAEVTVDLARARVDYWRARISDACDAKIASTSAPGWWICSTS
jgi:hypothetical protein